MHRVNRGYTHPKTDFLGVHAAQLLCGARCALELLVENILKIHTVALKTRSVDVGKVIADYVHSGLMILKS
jgi:hypothetical protein